MRCIIQFLLSVLAKSFASRDVISDRNYDVLERMLDIAISQNKTVLLRLPQISLFLSKKTFVCEYLKYY